MIPWRAPPTSAYRFAARNPAWELPFLRRVAEGLAALPKGHAVLLERNGLGAPTLLPSGTVAAGVVARAAADLPGTLEPARWDSGPDRRTERLVFAVLVAPAAERPVSREAPPPNRSPAEPLWDWLPEEAEPAVRVGRSGAAVQWHWFSTSGGPLAVRVRLKASATSPDERRALAGVAAAIVSRLELSPASVGFRSFSDSRRRRRAWARGSLAAIARGPPFFLPPAAAAKAVGTAAPPVPFDDALLARHVAVLGASGAGKSAFLASLARRRIGDGRATVVLDVHGDLGPAIAAGLAPAARARVVAIDACAPARAIRGTALFSGVSAAQRERESAHLVTGFRHLSHDGTELFWGSRLEQVFDVFVRLVEEERGGLADLYELLTEPARREAARLATRRPAIVRFLEELPALVRRNPEYLLPAVARLQKVVLQPKLSALLDARDGAIDPASEIDAGRSLLFRIPAAELGPSGSRFAATLLLSRLYLALAARGVSEERLRVLAVLDEAHSIAPSLLAEILAEGRKFGVGIVLATQYAARLAPEALAAVEGAAGTHLVFQVPRSGAAAAGRWLGLDREVAERLLPALPAGVGLLEVPLGRGPRRLLEVARPLPGDPSIWSALLGEPPREEEPVEERPPGDGAALDEALLVALAGAQARRQMTTPARTLAAAAGLSGTDDLTALQGRLMAVYRRGWAEPAGSGTIRLTATGARRLGVGAPSGAARESAEHRRLLVEAFWIFARHGARFEFVRQGRFDVRLPDGLVRQLPEGIGAMSRERLRRVVETQAKAWSWRAFAGKDVHVEAEVTGAGRPDRIRRGLSKARARKAAVVFLVGDGRQALRVRKVLTRAGAHPPEAHVWVLRRPPTERQADEPKEPPETAPDGDGCGPS